MKSKKLLALLLSAGMTLSMLSGCGGTAETEVPDTTEVEQGHEGNTDPDQGQEPAPAQDTTIVYATSTFGQKFSPFFATTAYDMEVVNLTQGGLLAADRGGAIINNGIAGETVNYNGSDYEYTGMGDVEVVQNADGSVDYNLTMKEGIKFSDGVDATIDDVIFTIYVLSDPTYDGSSTIYALPIEGMEEYRGGMDSRGNVIFADGNEGYTANDLYTEDQYNKFWDYYNNNAGADFAQEIIDYLVDNGYNSADDSVAVCAENWGFALEDGATTQDFWDAIVAAYDTVEEAEATESAGSTRLSLTIAALGAEFESGVSTGETAANISGIERTGDYSMTIHMTEYDATAIYEMNFTIAPLHYYGDTSLYVYANNSFGFVKGDLSGVKARNTQPLGCGPYTFEGYSNGVVTLKANPYYFEGEPKTTYILMQESVDSDYVPGIVTGSFDIAVPSISDDVVKAIRDANGGDLIGNTITTALVDYRGYGYLGINADLVNVGGDPGSDASKNLRKGFMTLFSVYRDTVINSYYGDRASVIQYPISNTSWAAPRPADEGYVTAYSVDVDGNAIYDSSMNEEQRYEAARQAAIGYFIAAGFTFDEATGQFTDCTQTYEIMIPGQGQQDHPAYGVAVAASEVLESLGIKLQVNDVGTSVWNNALESNTAMMWAAAWQASVDPDMTQVYSSANAHGNGTNSNHYAVDDAELDALILAGRRSADTEERKSIYKEAMEIIMDWGCELPLYQRKDCTTFSTMRIDINTIPQDMTPYWGWYAEINNMATR
ncbi:MAG: ABC transporter substrate-binding protein [Lachnospiraceae bacterium]|nr:ABC transporter substrate-binding protein [Lachnospiraceae bacterium]